VKVAVYQRHLATLGGGERHALELARFFRDRGDRVDVLAPPGTPLEVASERLGIDVDGLGLVTVDPRRPCHDASERSGGYDCFVNVTYGSEAVNLSPLGIYACHFPWRHEADEVSWATTPGVAGSEDLAWVRPLDGMQRDPARGWWTNGHAVLDVSTAGRAPWVLALRVGSSHRGWGVGARTVDVLLDGHPIRRVRLPPRGAHRTIRIRLPRVRSHSQHRISLVSSAAVEPATGQRLGVHLKAIGIAAPGCVTPEHGPAPFAMRSYPLVLAHSAYVARWIRTWWGLDSTVVHPAVAPVQVPGNARDPAERRAIVIVGRFFTEGHSKCQADLVSAFRGLHDGGLEGWRLHLVGGVDGPQGRRYLEHVKGLAAGYPIDIHANASRPELERRVAGASIVWHASGWRNVARVDPGRFEHFGIGIVEAMSAGAVPVVLGIGGPDEIVRHGVDGLKWIDGPEEATASLAGNPRLLREMSRNATKRAAAFGPAAFDSRLSEALTSFP
jgi:glycosyltransferase involved in cell wall biosynthesis